MVAYYALVSACLSPISIALQHTLCVICQQHVPLEHTTAGGVHADGSQAFACTTHLRERPRWITSWASFSAAATDNRSLH